MTTSGPSALLLHFARTAHAAGSRIMQIYTSGATVRTKQDNSPVTEADIAAEAIIVEAIRARHSDANIIAEEAVAQGDDVYVSDKFFLVDPLDGTREFISRNGEFTVNIALVNNRASIAGAVYAPALSKLFVGEVGHGCWSTRIDAATAFPDDPDWQVLTCPDMPQGPVKVVASRSHRDPKTDAWLAQHDVAETISAGSSLKFCLLCEGKAHVYPRFGRTMEWDTAAGQAVLVAAGGSVVTEDGSALCYGKAERGFDNPAFIASVNPDGF